MSTSREVAKLDKQIRASPLPREGNLVVYHNPRAGRRRAGNAGERLAESFRHWGLPCLCTTQLPRALELAAQWSEQEALRAFVVLGGDGTVHQVISHLSVQVPLVVAPWGTENLIARFLGTPAHPRPLARWILEGWIVWLDCGEVEYPDRQCGKKRFLLVASAGLDAEVVHRLARWGKDNHSQIHYLPPLLESLRAYSYPAFHLRWSTQEAMLQECRVRWCMMLNLPMLFWGLPWGWEANPWDGQLTLMGTKGSGMWPAAKFLLGSLSGRMSGADVYDLRATWVELHSQEGSVPLELDGDPSGALPVRVRCVSAAVPVVVSHQQLVRWGLLSERA